MNHGPGVACSACRATCDDRLVRVQSFAAQHFRCCRPRLVDLRCRRASDCSGDLSIGGAHIDTPTLMEWVTPIVTAGFVFGFPARTYWPYARRPAFCATLFPLILLHFLFFLVVLPFVWRGNPLLVAILGLPEMFITYIALILVLRKPPRPPG